MAKMTWYDKSSLYCQDLFVSNVFTQVFFLHEKRLLKAELKHILMNSERETMGLGLIYFWKCPCRRGHENAQLDFKERQHGFSPRLGGMQTWALLKQYWGAVGLIYRDKEKHTFFSWALMAEVSSENAGVHISTHYYLWWQTVVHRCQCCHLIGCDRQGIISMLLCLQVVQTAIPVSLHIFLFYSITPSPRPDLIIPSGSIRLLTSLTCNFSLNLEDPASVSRKQKLWSLKQKRPSEDCCCKVRKALDHLKIERHCISITINCNHPQGF